jgi:hypothetical protein
MSQFEAPFGESAMAPRKTSGLAITALVCSLIFCCPLTTLLGILLGLIAFAITGPGSARRGRGLAAVAIIIGLVATALQVWGGYAMYEKVWRPVLEGPTDALTAGFAGDAAGFKAGFYGAGAAATDAEATAFIDELRRRYGEFDSCEFSPVQTSDPTPGQPSAPFNYVLHFAGATVDAEAEMIFSDPARGGFIMKFGYLVVSDSDLGDLKYPPAPTP